MLPVFVFGSPVRDAMCCACRRAVLSTSVALLFLAGFGGQFVWFWSELVFGSTGKVKWIVVALLRNLGYSIYSAYEFIGFF